MGKTIFEELCEINSAVKLQNRFLKRKLAEDELLLYNNIAIYFEEYCKYYNLTANKVSELINTFAQRYSKNIVDFINTGKYPYLLEDSVEKISRLEYDIVLIASCLYTKHRFDIYKYITSFEIIGGGGENSLLIGIGSGLELNILDSLNLSNIDGYDIEISDFVYDRFKTNEKISLKETIYKAGETKYRNIFAIELIEHVEDYIPLIEDIYKSLETNGNFMFTTVTNVPQFDHLINFTDLEKFEKILYDMGFVIDERIMINHDYKVHKINAYNTLYKVRRI